MLIFIDHYDSFAHILMDYFSQLGESAFALKTDQVDEHIDLSLFDAVVIGPGPGHPDELSFLYPYIERMIKAHIPLLGVCLGHQLIAQYFGARVVHAKKIMHGQCSEIDFIKHPLYQGLSSPIQVTRYHSLIVDELSLPECLQVLAKTTDNELMAFSHQSLPVYGIQYHPEAYLTDGGLIMLQNFLLANKRL
ncbi:anthranilate synthase component II [Caedibacter taeniospiralis]|uniref:anthranilate synthase component II n=1 Tax=Caedibacter taeniospiralis TaxID=28907 RepID=UPI000C279D43|nr:aminodeoxychorismate/anthranilate synthase component II [Caedibacter taeniospiralis]